jgi:rubrerythrin
MHDEPALIADLNDLLQLDHDAVEAYTLAINLVRSDVHRERLVAFRADHKRHIEELAALIRDRRGVAVELPHPPTAPFKFAVQGVGLAGGDAAVLLAFKANERQVRDKYARYAARSYPTDVLAVIRRAADDEERHYRWVSDTLTTMGHGDRSMTGMAERVFERVHARVADAVERAERKVMEGVERVRRDFR